MVEEPVQFFSALLSKQKLYRMPTGCQKDRLTDRQKDRKTFQLSYRNKSCSEGQQDVRNIQGVPKKLDKVVSYSGISRQTHQYN